MMSQILLREANRGDVEAIYRLYLIVARAFPDSITQHRSEITQDFVDDILTQSMRYGLAIVAESERGSVIGLFKGYTSPYRNLAHVMMNATLICTPDSAGRRAFVVLFRAFLDKLKNEFCHIYKLQSRPHEANRTAINCYLRNGMYVETVFKDHIFNISKSVLENEVIASWMNPNFNMGDLKKYHEYLPAAIKKPDSTYFKTLCGHRTKK
jgi:RimJ/RimL family protein N-acetyltransferase